MGRWFNVTSSIWTQPDHQGSFLFIINQGQFLRKLTYLLKIKLTWGKSTFLHFFPVVQESKEVIPSCAPEGGRFQGNPV